MRITKFVHSCLLVEEKAQQILIDPGEYTYNSKSLNVEVIGKIDQILVTHEHPDHLYLPLLQEILEKNPEVKIISNTSVGKLLEAESIKLSESTEISAMHFVPHEKVFGVEPPANVLFEVFHKLTHPGDCLHFELKTPVLALPLQAPWCNLTEAVTLAEQLRPEIIVPIHDWHWNDAARKGFYTRLEEYFGKIGIRFIGLETGISVEV